MLKISEFSKLSHLTIKALRYYEKEGLLEHASIDKWNNYRFYETSQLEIAARIKAYRQLDLSIEEIRAVFSGADVKEILRGKAKSLSNGYKINGPARECYSDGIRNKETPEEWLTEIQLPIEGSNE